MAFDIRFKTSFNCIVSGVTQSGKTTWVKNLLTIRNDIFSTPPDKIFVFYKMMQDIYTEMKENGLIDELIDVNEHFPTLDMIHNMVNPFKEKNGCLIIFDDIMTEVTEDFEQLFCNVGHHDKTSIIFLTQSLFVQDNSFRLMSQNSHYFVVMKNARNSQQIGILSRQIKPKNSNFVIEAYNNATKNPYSYLLFDFSPETNELLRLRTNLFPHEFPVKVYIENNSKC